MKTLAYHAVFNQSDRKANQVGAVLQFLFLKTAISYNKINKMTPRQWVKLAKRQGWDATKALDDYADRWQERQEFQQAA